ncbi:DUF4097 family beta strand repeat-containing protein [Candidatus Enterococcus clewellii]|uniref:DUF4097 domain-containing protein n=1 Tax=Candidatus Enterococcus clewellii TaxID=1834193 RepID=A0A242K378_9ENTE|nr:DUF4097 family beta strand repeat-containing protein [Enterococcus sp. 9E7_DIV0242]OTP13459.1 hypothetical protein A5888_002937 [Enterococcus sp. 9E7_DIV0242]
MKKTTIFFLLTGILTMAVGGIGSAIFYQRAQTTMIEHINDSYTIKNKDKIKTLNLKLSGNADYVIQGTTDSDVSMEARSSVTEPLKGSLDVEESGDTLTVSVNGKQSNGTFDNFRFGFHIESSQIVLTVPNDIDIINISDDASSYIDLSNFSNKEISMKLKNSDVSASSLASEKVKITGKSSDINFWGDSKIDELTIETEHGQIDLNNFVGSSVDLSTSSGDIYLSEVKSTTTNITSKNGEISLYNLRGEADVSGNNGSIYLYGEEFPDKLNATMEHGDIELSLYGEIKNLAIDIDTDLGDKEIFGEERSSYTIGSGKNEFNLKTKTGDINVYGDYYYDEEYTDED